VSPVIGKAGFADTVDPLVGVYADKDRIPWRTLGAVNVKYLDVGNFHDVLLFG
jgi:hypothetical protein